MDLGGDLPAGRATRPPETLGGSTWPPGPPAPCMWGLPVASPPRQRVLVAMESGLKVKLGPWPEPSSRPQTPRVYLNNSLQGTPLTTMQPRTHVTSSASEDGMLGGAGGGGQELSPAEELEKWLYV